MENKSIETLLQEVIDREEIRTLPMRYCHCIWQKDVDGYVNLFTEDGEISINDPILPRTQGREKLREMIKNDVMSPMKPRPFIHNHVVELLSAERAKGTCYLEARLIRDDKPWAMVAWYDDEYAKVGGEWKFKSRQITVDSLAPVSNS
ncbi:MAG: nuclear transport factor 2 family protein [Syntrophales bacterium]